MEMHYWNILHLAHKQKFPKKCISYTLIGTREERYVSF